MLEEFMNVMTDDNLKNVENDEMKTEVKNIIDGLELFTNDSKMLTNAYTDILTNDNVVYLITRISQNPILNVHFPEFYVQNENGESVINCQQNSPYHRFGVFRHILYTVEYVGKDNLKYSKQDLKILKWTMFLHDIGKPFVKTTNAEGRDSFAGHDDVSVEMAKGILARFNFTQEETKIILTLIKYHDRYLNEGELTRDNLEFLAQELENKKELFEFLIEVKTAEKRAKSLDVYKNFLTILPKYEAFANEYFKDIELPKSEEVVVEFENEDNTLPDDEIIGKEEHQIPESVKVTHNKPRKDKRMTEEEFDTIYDLIINDQDITYLYQPIIDTASKSLFAYDVSATVLDEENMNRVYVAAKEEGKYDKVRQLLLNNSVSNAIKNKKNKDLTIVVRTDLYSFVKYNNKTRIYDAMDKDNIIISFENYDDSNAVEINNLCKEIRKKHGQVMLSAFNNSKFDLKDLSNLEVNFIEYVMDAKAEDEKINDIIKICAKDTKKIIVNNVDTKKQLKELEKLDLNLFEGNAIFIAHDNMEVTDYEVEKFIDNI